MNEDQKKVSQFTRDNNLDTSPEYRLLDLLSELGELSKEILKSTEYGKTSFQPNDAWADELGDVYFSFLALANQTDINLSTQLLENIAKYKNRINQSGEAGSER